MKHYIIMMYTMGYLLPYRYLL